MFGSKKIRIAIVSLLLVAAAAGVFVWSQRGSLKPEDVKVGIETNKVRLSWKTFSYNESGHFGTKTQYESRRGDSEGGSYSLHCRDGKVFAVEVIYPAGVERERSLALIRRVLQQDVSKPVEHDDEELRIKNCARPSEYFYFGNGKLGAQIDYADGSKRRIARVYCWTS